MSFGERNWHGIVRGQGYVRVLAGRARSDMLRDSQRLTPRLTQPTDSPTEFLYHPLKVVNVIICHVYYLKWAKTRLVTISHCKIDHFLNSRGRDAILPTQRIPRGRDWILSTQRIRRGRELILPTQRIPRGRDGLWVREMRRIASRAAICVQKRTMLMLPCVPSQKITK